MNRMDQALVLSRDRFRRTDIFLILIIFLAFALRVYALDRQSFWSDEGLSVHYASSPVGELLTRIRVGFHNPLYFLGLHFWMGLAGESDWAIRFFSVWPSVLAVALLFKLGQLLYGRHAGLLSALVLAANPFAVYYAQEARMYAQILALGLACVLLYLLALRHNKFVHWLGFVVTSAACLYTHYFAALAPLAVGAHYVFNWLRGRNRSGIVPWLISQAAVLTLYFPWLSNALNTAGVESWQKPVPPLLLLWRTLGSFSLGEVFPPLSHLPLLTAAFGLLFLAGCFALYLFGQERGGLVWLVPFYFGLPLIIMVTLAWTGRGILDKYLTVILAPFCLILALGLLSLGRLSWLLAVLGLTSLLAVDTVSLHTYYTDERYFKSDYRATAAHIARRSQPGDVILADGINPNIVFERYYTGGLPIYRVDLGEPDEEKKLLADLASRHKRAWLVLNFNQPGRIEHWLESHGYQLERGEHSTIKLYLYGFPDGAEEAALVADPPQSNSGPVRLSAYRIFPNPVTDGHPIYLSLIWETTAPPGINYKESLRLNDAAGHVVWARDRWPIEGIVPSATWQPNRPITDNLGIQVPLGTLPGSYDVTAVLYDPTGTEVVNAVLGPLEVNRPSEPPAADNSTLLTASSANPVVFGAMELLNYELAPGPVLAGGTLDLFLTWRALEPLKTEAIALLQLQDKAGKMVFEQRAPHDAYPTMDWQVGEIVRYPYRLKLNPVLDSGTYQLVVNLIGAETEQPWSTVPVFLADITVVGRERTYTRPHDISYETVVTLGEWIRLLGYDLRPTEAAPGESVQVTLYWQALGTPERDYVVFTHLLTPDGRLADGHDSSPLDGAAPTTGWLEGEVLTDHYHLTVPPDGEPGAYGVEVGMYDPQTGERLPLLRAGERQPGDRLLLDLTVHVRE